MGQMEFRQMLESVVGPDMTQTIGTVVESTSRGSSGLWSSVLAVGTLLFGATTLLSQFKHTLNMIWDASEPDISTVWYFLWSRLMGLLFIGTLSLLLLGGLISETLLYHLGSFLSPIIGDKNIFLIQFGNFLINIVLAFSFFAALFKILPDVKIQWKDIAVGSMVTTILVMIGKTLVDWYLSAAGLQPAYVAAGSFVVFLIWIYYNVQVMLVGAIFTRVFTERHGGQVENYWKPG
jgi:membrane protein